MRITKKYTGNSSIGKRTFMPLMRSAENVVFIDSSRSELALLRTIWINKLFLTEKNGSRKAAKASLSPVDKATAHARGLPAKHQQQQPSLSPSTSAIDLEQWNRLIASGDLSNPLLQQLLTSSSASSMMNAASFESQEDSTVDAEGDADADDNDSADGASLSLSSSTMSDSPTLSLMSTVHRLKPKVSGSRLSEPVSYGQGGRLFTSVASSSTSVHDGSKAMTVLPPRVLAQMLPADFAQYQAQLQQSSTATMRLAGSKRPIDEAATSTAIGTDNGVEATKYRRFDDDVEEDSFNGPNDTLESAALALLGLCQR